MSSSGVNLTSSVAGEGRIVTADYVLIPFLDVLAMYSATRTSYEAERPDTALLTKTECILQEIDLGHATPSDFTPH